MSADVPSTYADLATHAIPFWLVLVALFAAFPFLALLGYRLGRRERIGVLAAGDAKGLPGETSLGALLALLGLLLGFTFSATLHWHEGRTAAVVEEAAAIGTAFLRADMLPEGAGRPLQEALLGYARTRVAPAGFHPSRSEVAAFVTASLEAQAAIWPALKGAVSHGVPAALQVHASAGVTEVLDAHTRRMAAASKGIPPLTMAFLIFVTGAGVFVVGNRSALQGRPVTWRTLLLSVVLACVIGMIEDLDRPNDGFTVVRQDAFVTTIAEMEGMLMRPNSVPRPSGA